MNQVPHTTNTFTHYHKVISPADHDWETAEAGKISGLNVNVKKANQLLDQHGRTLHRPKGKVSAYGHPIGHSLTRFQQSIIRPWISIFSCANCFFCP
jgi:hypothetical protein